jgi:hypothetical protein
MIVHELVTRHASLMAVLVFDQANSNTLTLSLTRLPPASDNRARSDPAADPSFAPRNTRKLNVWKRIDLLTTGLNGLIGSRSSWAVIDDLGQCA